MRREREEGEGGERGRREREEREGGERGRRERDNSYQKKRRYARKREREKVVLLYNASFPGLHYSETQGLCMYRGQNYSGTYL